MLVTIDDLLTPHELQQARAHLAAAVWSSGAHSAGPQAAQVKNNEQLADDAPQLPALRDLVLGALNRSALFFAAALPLKVLPPAFNRYSGAHNAYGWHTDCAMRRAPDAAAGYVRSDLSATLFLSDPADHDGGELCIEDTFGTHRIKGAAGSLVLYPSSSVHAVQPVTRGTRMACFMFIQSMVRDAGRRRLLYDMDMALLQLRQDVGDTDAVVRLTGAYHNLLRQWAEA